MEPSVTFGRSIHDSQKSQITSDIQNEKAPILLSMKDSGVFVAPALSGKGMAVMLISMTERLSAGSVLYLALMTGSEGRLNFHVLRRQISFHPEHTAKLALRAYTPGPHPEIERFGAVS